VTGRKQSKSEARRQWVEARRERRRLRAKRLVDAASREAAYRAALARPNAPQAAVEQLISTEVSAAADRLRELLMMIADNAPRLVNVDTVPALKLLAEAEWVRPLSAWRPAGKSRERVFRSLVEHLLARFVMPPFVWTAFFSDEDAATLARVVVHVAAGGSLFEAVKSGLMPVPLTRKMCHELLSGPGERLLDAVRRVQVRAAGGGSRLLNAWIRTRAGRRLHSREEEQFWQAILAWFSANPTLSPGEISPLVDYIEHRRQEDPSFSINGRSLRALVRAMEQWHRELAEHIATHGRSFPPSGLEPMDIEQPRRNQAGERVTDHWHFREILDTKALADEGRAMNHCVYSYAGRIERGECAIWTLTLEDETGHWRRLTIEVHLGLRQIGQARGRFNRFPEPRDMIPLQAWAARNDLRV
jgi:hypothetical protein